MLVQPVLTYGCHVFANKIFTDKIQTELLQINRLAVLSLGSVPRSSPTITLEVLYNLRSLDLEMEHISLKTHSRITQDPNRDHIWDGKGSNTTDGHLRYWHQKIVQYGIERLIDGDKITKTRVWNSFFTVPDFESTRNDAYVRGHRRTYLNILKRAWSANFKMVWYVLLRPLRPELNGQCKVHFKFVDACVKLLHNFYRNNFRDFQDCQDFQKDLPKVQEFIIKSGLDLTKFMY
jgi:hypothetical protein